ncbi:hypothetical protein MLD38_040420 [Melastoma candidum]|uniref:Uncharacterized protein n=1 Tax=Melastoma candidum TaxID=119954 RepID=A0ACB9L5M8_9MYRT|nr:hypothetical protein MLD38_040420 [Melastoma candidum]
MPGALDNASSSVPTGKGRLKRKRVPPIVPSKKPNTRASSTSKGESSEDTVEEVEANLARRPKKNKPAPIAKENLPQGDDSLEKDPQVTKPSIADPPITEKEGSVEVVPPMIGHSTVDTVATDKSRISKVSGTKPRIDCENIFTPPSPEAEDPSITVRGATEGVTRDVSEESSNEGANRTVNTNVLQDANPMRDVEVNVAPLTEPEPPRDIVEEQARPSVYAMLAPTGTIPMENVEGECRTPEVSKEMDVTFFELFEKIKVNIDPKEPSKLALRLLEALRHEEQSRTNFNEIFQIIDAIERHAKAPITLLGICQNVRESFWRSWEDWEKVLSDDKQWREFSSKLTNVQSAQDKMAAIVTEHQRLVEECQ